MIIDGRAIAQDIFNELKEKVAKRDEQPILSVIMVGENPASMSYVALKRKKAEQVGIKLNIFHFLEEVSEEEVVARIEREAQYGHAIIVQMPLPKHFDTKKILDAVPAHLDVDILSEAGKASFAQGENMFDQPVVGSMKAILEKHDIGIEGKKVVVVGQGDLVGKPAAAWFALRGAEVTATDKDTEDLAEVTKTADILVCGAGVSGLIQPDMIREGVIILDAGTSEDAGELRGDADPNCAEKASLFTPVPRGIGPITVAVLLQNVVNALD